MQTHDGFDGQIYDFIFKNKTCSDKNIYFSVLTVLFGSNNHFCVKLSNHVRWFFCMQSFVV